MATHACARALILGGYLLAVLLAGAAAGCGGASDASSPSAAPDGVTQSIPSPPTISGTPATTVMVGAAYSFQPSASDTTGGTLTFSIENQPSWTTFSTATGKLSGTPSAADVGMGASITISVSNGQASAELKPFQVQVSAAPGSSGSPPTISGTPPTQVQAGQPYSFTPTVSNPGGAALSFSIQNVPGWASFSIATGQLGGTPSASNVGTYSNIIISVSDGANTLSLPAFEITVSAGGAATLSWTPPTTNTNGTPLTDLTGYTINYGTSADSLTSSVNVPQATTTSYTFQGLSSGTWYFTVSAYASDGSQSAPSSVASKTIS
jgi:hypothetical protein